MSLKKKKMTTKKSRTTLTAFAGLVIIAFLAGTAAAQEPLHVDTPAPAAHVGDTINVTYHIVNAGGERKKFTCMLSFDPPTSQKPHCTSQNIELGPGESYNGSIAELAEVPTSSKVTVKLLDENQNVISEQTYPIKVLDAGRIACGDALCDVGENFQYCPQDCPSGGRDGYCDKQPDGKCDPDCARTEDPDCVCNRNGVCDFLLGENYASCPQDCPSGEQDAYCDKQADGKCDPDCSPTEDTDCTIAPVPDKPATQDYSSYAVYGAAGIAVLVLIATGAFFLHRKKQKANIDNERQEFERWKKEHGEK